MFGLARPFSVRENRLDVLYGRVSKAKRLIIRNRRLSYEQSVLSAIAHLQTDVKTLQRIYIYSVWCSAARNISREKINSFVRAFGGPIIIIFYSRHCIQKRRHLNSVTDENRRKGVVTVLTFVFFSEVKVFPECLFTWAERFGTKSRRVALLYVLDSELSENVIVICSDVVFFNFYLYFVVRMPEYILSNFYSVAFQ